MQSACYDASQASQLKHVQNCVQLYTQCKRSCKNGQVQPNACVCKHLTESSANSISRMEFGTYEVKDHDLEQDLQEEVLGI